MTTNLSPSPVVEECEKCTWRVVWGNGEECAAPKRGAWKRVCPFAHELGVEYRLSPKGEGILQALREKWRREEELELLEGLVRS